MKIFYDTEFNDHVCGAAGGDNRVIELISIGLVDDDGREYYAVNADLNLDHLWNNRWLADNVLPHLPIRNPRARLLCEIDRTHPAVRPRWVIRNEVHQFIKATPGPELWAWYGAYDQVVLAQLFGGLSDLPEGVPMWTNDLRQEHVRLGEPELPEQQGAVHDALADARHNRRIAQFLEYREMKQP